MPAASSQLEARLREMVGRQLGNWTILPGPALLIRNGRHGDCRDYKVPCRCSCGTERQVLVRNLLGGLSKSCGCNRTRGKRVIFPWLCLKTGEKLPSTAALARHLGLSPMTLARAAQKHRHYYDQHGQRWDALVDEAIPHENRFGPWVEVDTGRKFDNLTAVAEHIGTNILSIKAVVSKGRAYAAANGHWYAPVGRVDQLLLKPRGATPMAWIEVESGQTWPTMKDCARALGVDPATLRYWRDKQGSFRAANGHTYRPAEGA